MIFDGAFDVSLPSSLSYLTHRERISSFSFPIFAAIIAAQGYAMGKFWFVLVEVLLGIFCDDVASPGLP